jgi:hypothetical protein
VVVVCGVLRSILGLSVGVRFCFVLALRSSLFALAFALS